MDELTISTSGTSVVFGGVTAVRDVDFEAVGPGVVGVMGPNGSGKSTLLNVLSGLQRPTSGTTRVCGREMTSYAARRFAAAGVARTFQTVRLVGDLRVRDNILVAAGQGAGPAALAPIADALELGPYLDRWPDELPYGVQRRVELARVAVRPSRVVLLDEPSAGMRRAEAEEIGDFMLRLAEERLLVLVDHYVELMTRVCGRVVVLNNGEVIADGGPRETLGSDVVRAAYFGS